MIQMLKKNINLLSNMGFRYLIFRVFYIIKTKLGWHKKTFPTSPEFKSYTSLKEWKKDIPPFFFFGKNIKGLKKTPNPELKKTIEEYKLGIFTYFSKTKINIGVKYNWVTNPITNYTYDINKHWSEIQDLSKEAGDIKYVWEKARFSFLYDVIRYDYHFEDDQSEYVFNEIIDFIDENPINQGPNYKCSQEISLRVLNWTFALYYYKDSKNLTEEIFQKIIYNIYWQTHHVYNNIHFSRISVRNNHAITETLMLYLSCKLFPFLPNVKKWSKKGKKWFEQEVEYQIYEDGTFLQFSMNYHRVVVQLLTWAIELSKLNRDSFKPIVYERAQKLLYFLDTCSDSVTGKLPNYGANDGALFFKLTDDDYRNYRSQLDDLRSVLTGCTNYNTNSIFWYGRQPKYEKVKKNNEINSFKTSGYYIIQEDFVKTFIRCGAYKSRPNQSDNLHIDIWYKGENILWDTGSYKYNTSKENELFFKGCKGHNTLSINSKNQMLKGSRFIWYYWVKKANAKLFKDKGKYVFKGEIKGFKELGKNIYHARIVEKNEKESCWFVKDRIKGIKNTEIQQFWQINPNWKDRLVFECFDTNSNEIEPIIENKWCSNYYGVKEKSIRITFKSNAQGFNTKIFLKE